MMRYTVQQKIFQFINPAGTSRGVLHEKKSWFINVWSEDQPEISGLGECSIIPGLTPEYISDHDYEDRIHQALLRIEELPQEASIRFGIESALLDLKHGGKRIYFDNSFTRGQRKIAINGLIWMGTIPFMQAQIEQKLQAGFTTLKFKISAELIDEELELIRSVRKRPGGDKLTLRVDANGSFDEQTINKVLLELSELGIHSIEQPVKPGNISLMSGICAESIIPIALDEELINVNQSDKKIQLLEEIRPQYIILKPSLHGGISGVQEWIKLAEERQIGWWITSALESSIGLEVICQLAGEYSNELPQGLGTGGLYHNNIDTKLEVKKGTISYRK